MMEEGEEEEMEDCGGGGERNVPERELWVVENKSGREEEYQPIRVRVGPP